ncbi:MAG: hypothetical protein PHI74_07875 [Methanocellales archaeon]|nr:hypothetical protein [Methanocellales archaeon]MDD3292450.1 hypothetical protein [Methanocellales archaeon]MDD5485927.1 hypothetical protein [Methanocellales archaeon]
MYLHIGGGDAKKAKRWRLGRGDGTCNAVGYALQVGPRLSDKEFGR